MSENQAPVDAPKAQSLQSLRRQLETGSASLNLDDVTIKLGHSRLIEGLSLSVSSGETVTLMGRSGCGKSTLLAWLCGTLAPAFGAEGRVALGKRSEEHTSELQSLMRISYAVFCLKKKKQPTHVEAENNLMLHEAEKHN